VTIVDVDPGKPARVDEVALSAGRRLIDLHVRLDELSDWIGADENAYARVFLECDGPAPGLFERVQEFLPNTVDVRLVYDRKDVEREISDHRAMKPDELFSRYYEFQHGVAPDKQVLALFKELFEEVSGGAPIEA
jgi:exonuclease SbcD